MASRNTALAPIKDYAIATMSPAEIRESIAENLGGGTISVSDLDRVKFPSGGGLIWEVPGLDGVEPAKELVGVIVYWRDNRAMWRQSIEEGGSGSPPDCSGRLVELVAGQGKTWLGKGNRDGDGDLGPHDCGTCQYNEFGSADKGEGKKCKETRVVGILTEGAILPLIVNIPPTSLKAVRSFFLRLAGKRTPYWSVVTRIKLAEAQNKGGVKYAEGAFEVVEALEGPIKEQVRDYVAMIGPILDTVSAQAEGDASGGSSFAEQGDLEEIDTTQEAEYTTIEQ